MKELKEYESPEWKPVELYRVPFTKEMAATVVAPERPNSMNGTFKFDPAEEYDFIIWRGLDDAYGPSRVACWALIELKRLKDYRWGGEWLDSLMRTFPLPADELRPDVFNMPPPIWGHKECTTFTLDGACQAIAEYTEYVTELLMAADRMSELKACRDAFEGMIKRVAELDKTIVSTSEPIAVSEPTQPL